MHSKSFTISFALGLGAFIWLADGLLDYLLFYKGRGSLLELLFTQIPGHEIYIRSLIMLCFLGFGIAMCSMSAKLKKTRDEAQENEQTLFTTMRSIGDGVIATDNREKVTFLNRAAEELTGWSMREAKGRPLTEVFHIINAKTRKQQHNPVAKVLRTGKVVGLANHTALISRNGREAQIADSAAGIFDSSGTVQGVVLVFRDVTKEYEARAAIRRSEEQFRLIFSSNPTGMALVDTHRHCFLKTNQSFRNIVGYDEQELEGMEVKNVHHPDDWEVESARIRKILDQGLSADNAVVKRYVHKNGQERWVRVRAEMLQADAGQSSLAIASVEDITERKTALDSLRESEERIRVLFDQAADAMYVCGESGRLVDVNRAACRATGHDRSELLGMSLSDVDAEFAAGTNLWSVFSTGSPDGPVTIQSRHRRKDGSDFPVEITLGGFQTSGGRLYLGIARDISRRLEREITYSNILKTAHDGFWVVGADGRLAECNPAAAKMLGYSRQEMLGRPVAEFEANEGQEDVAKHMLQVKETGSCHFETRHRRKDGTCLDVDISSSYLPLGKGRFITFVRDISQRRKAEKAIIENEERLSSILENMADGVFVHDPDGNIVMVNQAACLNTGYSRDELLGMQVGDLDRAIHTRSDGENIWRKMNCRNSFELETIHRRKDGSEYPAEIRLTAITLRGAIMILSLARDISDRKAVEKERLALESQLRQAQKMEAVGTLAGGIAHDFNNILSAITGYSELALDAAQEGKPVSSEIHQVLKAADRAKTLVQQILAFSRKGAIETRPLNINAVITDSAQILERTLPKMIELKLRPAKGLKLVNGDPNQMEQMILNLATNAQGAMPEGGSLTLETKNAVLDHEFADANQGAVSGEYVQLVVSDTGVGIDPAIMEHIFEPFFTTKEVGKGTGLGLASTYGIVKSHDGYITCRSQPGAGTTFDIYFPALSGESSLSQQPESRDEPLEGGKETILLVDDEESLRRVAARFLQGSGYKVLLASSGEKALETYAREGRGIDLVIMDLSMPGMGGRRAIREILAVNPEAKVIIASGYSSGPQGERKQEEGVREYIAKPFRRHELLSAVRKTLDEGGEVSPETDPAGQA